MYDLQWHRGRYNGNDDSMMINHSYVQSTTFFDNIHVIISLINCYLTPKEITLKLCASISSVILRVGLHTVVLGLMS